MAELFLFGRSVHSIFELLGSKEDDVTYSVGWAFANCPEFLRRFTLLHFPDLVEVDSDASIYLQHIRQEGGRTDIEIVSSQYHIIIEAKRGWNFPSDTQLEKYTPRFRQGNVNTVLSVLTEASPDYASQHLPQQVNGVRVQYASWKQIAQLATQSIPSSSHAEKRLLRELINYFGRLITMQNHESNRVYVVSLGSGKPDWATISWRDIVNTHGRYFHPIGVNGWPKEPPNYVAFRYGGELHSIHHVDSYEVVTDVSNIGDVIPGIDGVEWRKEQTNTLFLYTLGPAIKPFHQVKSGAIVQSNRVWVALDLLLTCNTISEARDLTQLRGIAEHAVSNGDD
jgi:hypothetical protein